MNTDRRAARLVALGALVVGAAVAAGAFGAHGLKAMVTPERLAVFETGARYAMYHGLALVLVGMLVRLWPERSSAFGRVAVLLGLGVAVFSGSLFALVLLDLPVLGAITPVGGVAMIAGWALLAWTMARA
ncbi:MAG: DUF423 domain-containing protein [Rhodothermales bacterium]|nr:DUF423 domain-containing protein [Rhodothermales bacterium]